MNAEIKKVIHALKESFEGQPWYGGSLMGRLNKMAPEIVNFVPVGSTNSVAKIVQHIINWRVFAIEKLKGNIEFDIGLNTPDDWGEVVIGSENEWLELKQRLVRTQEVLVELLSSMNDELLKKKTSGRDYDFQYLIEGIIQHDIYHLGQIAITVKQARAARKNK